MLSAQIRKYKPKRAAMDLTESVGEAAKRNADAIHRFKSLADKRRKIEDEKASKKHRGACVFLCFKTWSFLEKRPIVRLD